MTINRLIAVFSTGAPELVETVELYEQTWDKVGRKHDERITLEAVETAIARPTKISSSRTHETSICFISAHIKTSGGAELRVPVKVYPDRPGIITSAHFGEPDEHGEIIWIGGGDNV